MAKLYKVEMYLLDINDDYDSLDNIVKIIKDSTEVIPDYFSNKSIVFDWDDNLPINFNGCSKEDYEKVINQ